MIFFGDFSRIFGYVTSTIGFFMIFKKCDVKWWYSFIPVVREYQIALCSDKEKEGQTYAIINFLAYAVGFMTFFYEEGSKYILIPFFILLALAFALSIYKIRIYVGFVKNFGLSKKWVVFFLFFEGIACLVVGLNKNIQPVKKVVNYKLLDEAKIGGIKADSIDDGLTVNITDRSILDFFRKKYLLKDIHLTIPKGHMVLLLGGSGAGKTTFVNAVTGYEKANATIELSKHDVYKEYGKMMYDIGFVPQQDLIRGNDTVLLTLTDAASLRLPSDISFADKRKRVADVLELFGLSAVKNNLVDKLSGGQRKRLSIAMEFISDPTLFILDEPDSGLDGVVARSLFKQLRAIADEGKIVIVITHTPDRVIDLFDDVIVLAKDQRRTGRLAFYGAIKDAYEFFGKSSMEEILLSINQKEEGGEGRAEEFVGKYVEKVQVEANV